ncbi:hypothetical protein HDU80_001286 [Chytriomyces hyalinus]|nr:hypothetical protein HDU80_001286 [Chytriomyces hyalinus]
MRKETKECCALANELRATDIKTDLTTIVSTLKASGQVSARMPKETQEVGREGSEPKGDTAEMEQSESKIRDWKFSAFDDGVSAKAEKMRYWPSGPEWVYDVSVSLDESRFMAAAPSSHANANELFEQVSAIKMESMRSVVSK